MDIDDGGLAFPIPDDRDEYGNGIREGSRGMTLRDWFAGKALSAFRDEINDSFKPASTIARAAYEIADAMIAARNPKEPT